jgi:hypothetical protein
LALVRSALEDPWHRGVLAGWAIFEALGRLAPTAMTGPTSRAWFDELRLESVVATALAGAGLNQAAAAAAAGRIRTLLALPRPSNVGGQSPAERARRLVDAWLVHPDVLAFLRVNRWEGVDWFGRDEWRELLDWTLLLDAIDSTDGEDIAQTGRLIASLADTGERAGYRLDRLTELVRPAKRSVDGATARASKTPAKARAQAGTKAGSKAGAARSKPKGPSRPG